jgi:small subunit ribosomal protein S20
MANTTSAKKRIRNTLRKTDINKSRKSRIKTFVKKVEDAIESKDAKSAIDSLKAAQPEIMRGVTKGIFHKNTASRKISRLSSRVKAISK